MLILAAALILADGAATAFPERVPALMEACLTAAVAAGDVTDTAESYKYICAGETAAGLWKFLEHAKVRPYEQDTPEGRWLSREFPLGGCFKRVPLPDGSGYRVPPMIPPFRSLTPNNGRWSWISS
jgi:hypothetical protein